MRASEILDAQVDLFNRLGESEGFQRNISLLAAHHLGGLDTRRNDPHDVAAKFAEAPRLLRRHVEASYAYRVSHDMTSMIEWTAAQLDETDEMMRALAPTECGIVCFDKPLRLTDIRGEEMLVHWLLWGPGHVGPQGHTTKYPTLMLWMFNDLWREPDEVQQLLRQEYYDNGGPRSGDADSTTREERIETYESLLKTLGRWATVGFSYFSDGTRLGKAQWTPGPAQVASVLEEGFTPTEGTNTHRLVHALWLLLGQTITKVEDDQPDRPSRRRSLKKGLPAKVSVIKLRREEGAHLREPGEGHTEWSHRWIVRRHWRWQPYGNRVCTQEEGHLYGPVALDNQVMVKACTHDGCEAYVARIVIEAHEKGPEGAPLVVPDKVYSLQQ